MGGRGASAVAPLLPQQARPSARIRSRAWLPPRSR
uniref:Uncharacterized protein n=1 Tax=Arundo donax TaxID=35708 RepID=A0A0A8Z6B9_ARUDO